MKQTIKKFFSHPLINGSSLVFIGTTLANMCHFFFNFFLVRTVSPIDYGTYTLLSTSISLAALAATALTPTIVRFASVYIARKEDAMAKGLYVFMTRFTGGIGLAIVLIFAISSVQLAKFFHIASPYFFILTGIAIAFSFVQLVNGSFLQAKLSFFYIGFTTFVGGLAKIILGALFILAGWKVGGALFAVVISFFLPYLVSFFPLRIFIFKHAVTPKIDLKELISYGLPSALALVCLTSFISTDIILVKHFFAPEPAGEYAAVTTIGKIIFYFTAPIGTVMFPMIVQRHVRKEAYNSIFALSVLLVLIPSVVLTLFYFFGATSIIHIILNKQEYAKTAVILGTYGVLMTVYSVLYLFVNFFLSIKKTFVFVPVFFGSVLQGVLLWFFHDTFYQVIWISIAVVSLLLMYFLLYYSQVYAAAKKTR